MRAAKLSTTSVEGVMGYPAANRAPAARAPSQQAWSPSRKWVPVITPLGSAFMQLPSFSPPVDGEIGAEHAAQVTAGTLIRCNNMRGMIALGIERGESARTLVGQNSTQNPHPLQRSTTTATEPRATSPPGGGGRTPVAKEPLHDSLTASISRLLRLYNSGAARRVLTH